MEAVLLENEKLNSVINIFNHSFCSAENVILKGGFEEPFYLAATKNTKAEIQFTRDYVSSALHELAHWCVAGKKRRQSDDYGYWYVPDGRDADQQTRFFEVEVLPQAYEFYLSLACKVEFKLSLDNVNGDVLMTDSFKQKVIECTRGFFKHNPEGRVTQLYNAYVKHFWEGIDFSDRESLINKNFETLGETL
jgi:elongation factor P hydroxylase